MQKKIIDKIRIAKFLASYNVGSRREVEKMILEGRISLNGQKINSPVHFVNQRDSIKLDGKLIIDHLSKLKRDIIIKKISKTKKNPDRILV